MAAIAGQPALIWQKAFASGAASRAAGVLRRAIFAVLALPFATVAPALAQGPATGAATATAAKSITILMVRELRDRLPPLSLLDQPPKDDGIAGAKLAIDDNNTTGRFLNQSFTLATLENADPSALVAAAKGEVEKGATGFIVADVAPDTLLQLSDAIAGKDAVIFNASAPDERLREEACRANVKHTAPSHAMLADGLAQYLAVKRWRRWLLVVGTQPDDALFADALRRAAKRFGHKIVEERIFKYEVGSRRADGGFEQIQQQIPSFLQGAADHDIVLVSDPGSLFSDYFPYRTWEARPVAGSAGLYATSWHPAVELWGGTQFQNRFKRLAGRNMRPLDYNVWMAVRSVGEAATRRRSGDTKELIAYMRLPEFELAAFKGRKLTYRDWNGQLRQPILVTTDKLHVTVSPQPEFLHQFSELDTLGIDKPETKCAAYTK
ncbi:MAG: ABC transporter substrate-binding protein [Hyphomicrobiaceae bacterium]|nr:ABC transporter substrate-binding protein [Hyphomicrobiaceae bacterium]